MDLEVCEVILVEDLERGLHPPHRQDLPAELDEARACVGRTTTDDRMAGVLDDLGQLPIEDIPQLPKIAQEVLLVVNLILKHLQETLASSTGLWD
jgi:hypothetical protein